MENNQTNNGTITAFQNDLKLSSGPAWEVALAVNIAMHSDGNKSRFLCFDDHTGAFIDLDLSGANEEIIARLKPDVAEQEQQAPSKVGRPKLGVVSKEITLLPRHWAWLGNQSGGASATLRKLVDQARKSAGNSEQASNSKDAADRFMSAMLGDQAGYEDAARALYRGDKTWFLELIQDWPSDLKDYVLQLAEPAFLTDKEAKYP